MKPFQFRLQAVLTLREQAEQAAQRACARACLALDAACARLRDADAAIADDEERRRARLAAGPRAKELEQWRLYAATLHDRRVQVAREAALARQQLEEARRGLLQASLQRETLERLRDRQRRVYDYEVARAEQKLIDEFSQRRPFPANSSREAPSLML